MHLVRQAQEYTNRTGRNGFHLTPLQLMFAMESFSHSDKTRLMGEALATSAGFGNEKAHKILVE